MDGRAAVIAKITRGSRVGDIAAYLHGPGHANDHHYEYRSPGNPRAGIEPSTKTAPGGRVIASSIGVEGAIDSAQWAADLRQAYQSRPEITKPIWQASLRAAPTDRTMSSREWSEIASRFMDEMGAGHHPWVAVRHGDDHIHVVVSRVNDDGVVWHGRNDRRAAQTACTSLEQRHGLTTAPRRKIDPQRSVAAERAAQRAKAITLKEQRAQAAEDRARSAQARREAALSFPPSPPTMRPAKTAAPAEPRPYRPPQPTRERDYGR